MSRRRRALAALLAVALAAVAWWALRRHPEGVATGDEKAAGRPEPAPPGLAPVGRPRPDEAPALASAPPAARAGGPRAGEAPPSPGARIHGRVTVAGREGPLPEGSRVEAFAADPSGAPALRRAPIDATGRYELVLDGPALPDATRFAVFARIPGWAWPNDVVTVGPGEDVELDLAAGEAGRDGVLRAQVLDPVDRPVAGLRLLVTTEGFRFAAGLPLFDPDAESREADGASSARGLEAVVTTDRQGRFELRGLAPVPRYAVSLDATWYVGYEGNGFLTIGDAVLRARPGFVLEGVVTDAETRDVLDSISRAEEVLVGDRSWGAHTTGGAGGRFRWCQPVPAGGESGFDVVLRVAARGYRRLERKVRFEPGRWSQRLELGLERLRPDEIGRLRLVHDLRDGSGRPVAVDVLEWEDQGAGNRSGHGVFVDYGADGFGTVELPAGPAHVRIVARPCANQAGVLEWDGTVDVTGALTTDFPVPFPPAGSILVRTTGGTGPGTLHLEGPENATIDLEVEEGATTVFLAAVPVGTWRVRFEGQGEASAASAEVAAGGVAEAFAPR